MTTTINLKHLIYEIIRVQIELGTFRFQDHLPTIKELSKHLHISTETLSLAYQQLQDHHYIKLSKNIGATVLVNYQDDEIQQHIQTYFSQHRDAILDLVHSFQPLFSQAQLLSLQKASTEELDELASLTMKQPGLLIYKSFNVYLKIYTCSGNKMLHHLLWHVYLFLFLPFFSIPQDEQYIETEKNRILQIVDVCQKQEYHKLPCIIRQSHENLCQTIYSFYTSVITESAEVQIPFTWNGYYRKEQKYSLCANIIKNINRGYYPEGTFLPSLSKMANTTGLSVSTIRRSLEVLNKMGVVKSINGSGTYVLTKEQIATEIDFSHPLIHQRLHDYLNSLSLCTFSFQQVLQCTFDNMKTADFEKFKSLLYYFKEQDKSELTAYAAFDIITNYCPFHTIRMIYQTLFEHMLWGYFLRASIHTTKASSLDFVLQSLEKKEYAKLATTFTELLVHDFTLVSHHLHEKGI